MFLQAIDFHPTDGVLLSNRSLCWLRLGQAEQALADAKACRALKPNWMKACYREGAALRLLQVTDNFLILSLVKLLQMAHSDLSS